MQQFVNKFSIAISQDKSEVMINFFQNAPIVPECEGGTQAHSDLDATVYSVSNLVMTGQCARNFVKTLNDLLEME